MADKQLRRFPVLPLVTAVALSIVAVYLVKIGNLLPERTEIWVDRSCAAVQVRYYVCGICVSTTVPEDWNRLAAYADKSDDWGNQQANWIFSSSCETWLGSYNLEYGEAHMLEVAAFFSGQIVGDSPGASRRSKAGVELNAPAKEMLALNVIHLMQLGIADDEVYSYVEASIKRFEEMNSEITANDLISIDNWLADPAPAHYFGPRRIY